MLNSTTVPFGQTADGRRLGLQELFAHAVATGWAPRHPCTDERELLTLDTSFVRGDCTAPLLLEGDQVYIDRHLPPEPGDLVSFALSARGAEAQNTPPLPPGQTPWAKGARWIKLFTRYHDIAMLLDRYGNSATASLMGGEHPDDHVPLHPVRNIRRGGRLLFTPDSHSSQIGVNAATAMFSTTVANQTVSTGGGGITTNSVGITVPNYPFDVDLEITFSGQAFMTASPSSFSLAAFAGTQTNASVATQVSVVSVAPWQPVSIAARFTVPANSGSITAGVGTNGNCTSSAGSCQFTILNASLRVTVVKR